MELHGNITASLSIPRIAVGLLIAGGVTVIAYAFTHYGLPAGAAVSMLPIGLCALWFSLRNPAVSMLGMLVLNYFIMYLGREFLHGVPVGLILDGAIFFNVAMVLMQALVQRVEWRRAATGVTLASAIWMIYCVLELFNPQSISPKGWTMAIRSLAFYFFLIVVLTQLTMARYKYLKAMLAVWSVLTLVAVLKALVQKYVGFNAAENYWLFVEGGSVTHIIYTGVRYFSVYSDAANFGAGMGLAMVVFSISALYYENRWMKIYLLAVAAAACYGMLISGTRSALAVPFAGYAVFVVLSRNFRMVIAGVILIIGAFIFLNFTSIGQGNSIIRRARSAFNTQDASFQVRLENQDRIRALMKDKPFGAGLGHGGGKAKVFAPNAPLSQIPTDSWFVMIWVETGIVGLLLHIGILLYILGRGAFLVAFRLRNNQLRGLTAALISGISGVVVMSYGNEVLGQIPTGAIIYMSMAFIFLSPRFDKELEEAELEKHAVPGKNLLALNPRSRTALPSTLAKE
ncbi:O-antigen ligase family protein [uncultured Alistipes sp.]|uniref:O-antigen ligase family protein n=1 Tax=uncultured Alistipes sp. TaxID=538949 RepID=UPI0025893B1B|nr:O-antigen ligase family protein [uncultured Alistipes sp.]